MVAFGLGEFHEVSNSSDRLHLQFDSGGSIHLREKNIAGPTERSRRRWAACISRFTLDVGRAPKCLPFVRARIRHLGLSPTQARGKDLRFSMKMMFAPVIETSLQPVRTVT